MVLVLPLVLMQVLVVMIDFLPERGDGNGSQFFRLFCCVLLSGVPVVAMEGDALPGRMAFSLYKTMGLEEQGGRGCCVAKDRDR